MHKNGIIILDFGSQYNQLIARRIREEGVYAEILPYYTNLEEIKLKNPKGVIFSGGPSSVNSEDAFLPVLSVFTGLSTCNHTSIVCPERIR